MQGTNNALIQPARKAQTPILGLILSGLPVTEGVPMSKELFISSSPHETKVAVLEDDELVEVYHERETGWALAGSIYKGRVTRVLPGMQSAFVDIGLERDAFLYVSDFFEDSEEYDKVVSEAEARVGRVTAAEVAGAPPPHFDVQAERRESPASEVGSSTQSTQTRSTTTPDEAVPSRVPEPTTAPVTAPEQGQPELGEHAAPALASTPGSEPIEPPLEANISSETTAPSERGAAAPASPTETAASTEAAPPAARASDYPERRGQEQRGRRRRRRGRGSLGDRKFNPQSEAKETRQAPTYDAPREFEIL